MAGKKINLQTGLTENEKRFCEEYLIDFNGTKAAIRAKYSKRTAASQASRLLRKVKIQEFLQSKKKKVEDKLEISLERTLNEIGRIAFQDPRNFYNEDGTFKNIHELDANTAAVMAGCEIEEDYGQDETGEPVKSGRNIKLKYWDKTKALEMLAKHFKLYSDAPPPNPFILNADKVVFR